MTPDRNPTGAESSVVSRFIVLAVLSGFAVAQPVYDLLRRSPEFLVVHGAGAIDTLGLVLVLSLGLPFALVVIEQIIGLAYLPAKRVAHRLICWVLLGLFFLQLGKRWLDPTWVGALAFALGASSLTVFAYQRFKVVSDFFRFVSPAILIFPLVFLLSPGIRGLISPPRPPERTAGSTERTNIPVVFIVFDALPVVSLMDAGRRVDPIRYPSFAALAADSTWFINATTVSDTTLKAVPTILSGLYPAEQSLPSHAYYPLNLFTLLGESHSMVVSEPLTQLCPRRLCPENGLPTGERIRALASDLWIVYLHLLATEDLSEDLPPISNSWKDFREIERTAPGQQKANRVGQFVGLVERIEPAPRQRLYFAHTLLPHPPHHYFPSGSRYTRAKRDPSGAGRQFGRWSDDEWEVRHSYQRHLLQLGFTDRLLGDLLAALRRSGLYDDALIVVTADHGASFHPGRAHRNLSDVNAADILSIPLFIKLPGQTRAAIDERPVETVDILPTIAEALGFDVGDAVDGRSLLDPDWRRDMIRVDGLPQTHLDPARLEEKYESLASKLETFGTGEEVGVFVAAEPYPELVGRELSELTIVEDGRYLAGVDLRKTFKGVQRGTFVAAQIEGSLVLPEEAESPVCLAVAVDGTTRATTCTYAGDPESRTKRWSALLPESSRLHRRDRVQIFVVEESAGGKLVLLDVAQR